MAPRIRADLAAIPTYVPGRNHPDAVKLASNEVTFGPLPAAAAAMLEAAALANRYPDNRSSELITALSERLEVSPEQIAIGCGSVALCYDLVRITCAGPDDEVLMAWRSFEAYPIAARVAGAMPVQVPLTDGHAHDLDALSAAITPNTRIVFVCNPNNPTGTMVGRGALERFLSSVPPQVLVVLDEAYIEYQRLEDPPDGVELSRVFSNVVVLRTFSKAYGLAGLRVGYAVGDRTVIAALAQVHVPFSVNRVAQAAATASLAAQGELLSRTDDLVLERERVRTALAEAGFRTPPSQTNFVWLPLGTDSPHFAETAAEAGVLVRAYPPDGVRVTIGDKPENDRFLSFTAGKRDRKQKHATSVATTAKG